ncbi:polysaccharide deacetylase family protein [Streptomyces sp. NPDC058045]|uniref:polysaccharide deacetylase family protein n=1 Tax=Streptomyces sp. NPDC058045 TaxID=3346311 RepID=UPI0036EC6DC9
MTHRTRSPHSPCPNHPAEGADTPGPVVSASAPAARDTPGGLPPWRPPVPPAPVLTVARGAGRAAVRLGAVAAAAGALGHVVPAGSWLPGVRRALLPRLAGLGSTTHVALTFDDGPDPATTPRFLDLLDLLDVRATFFVLGESVLRHPGLGAEIAGRGHELAVHGWRHTRPWLPDPARDHREIARARDLIADLAHRRPIWYRPPYGILTGGRWLGAVRCGLRPVLWSAWGRDWTADATPESVLGTVCRDLTGGGTVLLHDTDRTTAPGAWQATLAMLPDLVAHCREAGWAVGRLDRHGL